MSGRTILDTQDSSGWGSRAGPQNCQIANDSAANYSNSNFDIRQAFKGYAIYLLPFGRGQQFLNNNAGCGRSDWRLADFRHHGSLYRKSIHRDRMPKTLTRRQAASFPNWVPGAGYKPIDRRISNWFLPTAFSQPENGTFGDVRRNSLYGPGLNVVNLSRQIRAGKREVNAGIPEVRAIEVVALRPVSGATARLNAGGKRLSDVCTGTHLLQNGPICSQPRRDPCRDATAPSRRMGAFDPAAHALFVTVGHSRPSP